MTAVAVVHSSLGKSAVPRRIGLQAEEEEEEEEEEEASLTSQALRCTSLKEAPASPPPLQQPRSAAAPCRQHCRRRLSRLNPPNAPLSPPSLPPPTQAFPTDSPWHP
ncbi:hypothetical protein AAFF_G00058100 [Aldrovandia affinis]|uniref:Uncharacterized protein n=1 Tax=Aldrovandia affinis TaxID=143900 RepID=A0AAD7S2L3_9TELE|nr:hypothetical protein AAFF_G00058100 [Aldrovandia affinis]